MNKIRTAVLISGRGSNLAALLAAAKVPNFPAEISLVISDRPDAGGLNHARDHGVLAIVIQRAVFANRAAFESAMEAELERYGIDLVCLAGFMRLLSPAFVEAWRDRLVNIHPSLLPAFRGLNTHERALAAGARLHGATVHFVRAEMDHGPIIAQAALPVRPNDTADTLAARVLALEHKLYPRALARVAGFRAGRARPQEQPAASDAVVLASPL